MRLSCWKCGASLEALPLPLSRHDECPACTADLHVCRMCRFYDRSVSNACAEPIADFVANKERANFCGYLVAKPGATRGTPQQESSRSELNAVFGLSSDADAAGDADADRRALDDLFDDPG